MQAPFPACGNGAKTSSSRRFAPARRPLFQLRESGGVHECGLHLFDDLTIGLGGLGYLLPLGILAEGVPVFGGGLAAGMGQDVDQFVVFERRVFGSPVTHAPHVMPVKIVIVWSRKRDS